MIILGIPRFGYVGLIFRHCNQMGGYGENTNKPNELTIYLEGKQLLIPQTMNRYPLFNWTDAIEHCNQMGGYLPIMANKDDMENVLQESMYSIHCIQILFSVVKLVIFQHVGILFLHQVFSSYLVTKPDVGIKSETC